MPAWWGSAWDEVCWKTRKILENTLPYSNWKFTFCEWEIPRGLAIVDETRKLPLKGRMDLLLSNSSSDQKDQDVLVIDFKTGGDKKLSASSIRQGKGTQIVLYGLALHEMGAKSVSMIFIKPDLRDSEPVPLNLEDFEDIRRGLCGMHDSGVFGMIEEIRSEYSNRRDFPLATLPVDPDILEEKWMLTHPYFRNLDL
jgi:hypothetical protein